MLIDPSSNAAIDVRTGTTVALHGCGPYVETPEIAVSDTTVVCAVDVDGTPTQLVGLDAATGGELAWEMLSPNESSFSGAVLTDGRRVVDVDESDDGSNAIAYGFDLDN